MHSYKFSFLSVIIDYEYILISYQDECMLLAIPFINNLCYGFLKLYYINVSYYYKLMYLIVPFKHIYFLKIKENPATEKFIYLF